MTEKLNANQEAMLREAQRIAEEGVFDPEVVGTRVGLARDTVIRNLKKLGLAVPSGLPRDTNWVLTRKGGNPKFAGEETRS